MNLQLFSYVKKIDVIHTYYDDYNWDNKTERETLSRLAEKISTRACTCTTIFISVGN